MIKKKKEYDKETEYIPYFIQVRGCINCNASKLMREKHGTDYGMDHEIAAFCVLKGCTRLSPILEHCGGYSISNPFLDPEEMMKKALNYNNPLYIENARKYCKKIKDFFGHFYEMMGVDLDKIMAQNT